MVNVMHQGISFGATLHQSLLNCMPCRRGPEIVRVKWLCLKPHCSRNVRFSILIKRIEIWLTVVWKEVTLIFDKILLQILFLLCQFLSFFLYMLLLYAVFPQHDNEVSHHLWSSLWVSWPRHERNMTCILIGRGYLTFPRSKNSKFDVC